ncbi:protocatechuate 3,4-dioxygenase [Rubritalea tangerina]|uniref:Protocatechuate 3,4-dioxygenase n=2 Tax=Rubritalea tangerina TaxID=430798 RepID=A0ABW4Z7C9_9BACT
MKNPIDRRHALKTTLLGTAVGVFTSHNSEAKSSPTPPEIEGPFYPVTQQKDKDFDLTQIEGRSEKAKGEVVSLTGKVVDTEGNPIEDAMVEMWQANAAGRYAHPRDTSKAPLDPNFQGWAIVPSGKEGGFHFKTIKPGAYKVAKKWTRPPHLHFKITKFGFRPLTTQMYFPEDVELQKTDGLLQRKEKDAQILMIAKKIADGKYSYQIVLAKADQPDSPQQD